MARRRSEQGKRRNDDGGSRSADYLTAAVAVMAVVAALGAGYLLVDGADILRRQGEQTIEASNSPGGFMELRSAYATVEGGLAQQIVQLASLPQFMERADLRNITIEVQATGEAAVFTYSVTPGPGNFTLEVVRDADGSLRAENPVLTKGDLVEITLPLAATGVLLLAGQEAVHTQWVGDDAERNVWKMPLNVVGKRIAHLQLVQ